MQISEVDHFFSRGKFVNGWPNSSSVSFFSDATRSSASYDVVFDKKDIVTKLRPLIPQNRRAFWQELPENDAAEDLIEHEQTMTL